MTTLLLAALRDGGLDPATARALAAARALATPGTGGRGEQVDVLVAGYSCGGAAAEAAQLAGVRRVLVADAPHLAHQAAEPIAPLVVSLADRYAAIVAPASAAGCDILPRAAALLDVAMVSGVTKVVGPDTFERRAHAGAIVETVRASDPLKVLTVRSASFRPAAIRDGEPAPVEALDPPPDPGLATVMSTSSPPPGRPALAAARIVVAGGRGLGTADDFARLIHPLADRLGAALAGTRAAVEAGAVPPEALVGQTGLSVAPDLYFAIGLSGAMQHLAGMRDSRLVVAINRDPDAPIVREADLVLIGDLHAILPELTRLLGAGP